MATGLAAQPARDSKRFWRWLGVGVSVGLFVVALVVLYRVSQSIRLSEVVAALDAIPNWRIGLALALVAVSYLVLTFYDVLALRLAGRSLPYRKTAVASFIAFAFGHNIGMAMISAGSVRYRIYSAAGLSVADIGAVILMVTLTFGLGTAAVAGLVLLFEPAVLQPLLPVLPTTFTKGAGVMVLAGVGVYFVWRMFSPHAVSLWKYQLELPSPGMTLVQIALAAADLVASSAVMYALLPEHSGVSFPAFLGVFILAMVAGIASHVPGGLGVFETAMLLGLPQVPQESLLATLLVFRVLYYIIPFFVAALLLAGHEWRLQQRHIVHLGTMAQDWMERLLPQALGVTTLLAGAVLLLSGATPTAAHRLSLISEVVPLPLVELSHFVASVAGVLLVILARGLFLRLDGAWHLTVALLALGIMASLLKGLDYEEATILALILAMAWFGRPAFFRKASLMRQAFTPGWIITLAVIVGGSVWIGLFAYKHVEYSADLWWEFAFDANAPRFMRASVVVVVLAVGFALLKLLRPVAPPAALPGPAELERARAVIATSPVSEAHLALLGDKRLLFSPAGDAFVMYQIQGRSWIAMGDPIGNPAAFDELVWQFRQEVDLHGGRPVFYQVAASLLPLYLDLGMNLVKLGEEARVPLADFSVAGRARADLRAALRRVEREGGTFEILPPEAVPLVIDQLRAVSDAWLQHKKAREKGFSLGFFDAAYLSQLPCAVVRKGGVIVAFTNLWRSGTREELSIDLMRYSAEAPRGVMDYLFAQLMLWGKDQGYQWFNLGMAPLSGLEGHRLAPLWHQIGHVVFKHGDQFYNFEGLRSFKEKFQPEWRPRYLAVPGNLSLPAALLDVTALIGRGPRNHEGSATACALEAQAETSSPA